MGTIRDLADQTPETRNRAIDFFRAAALVTVVLGHWLASAIFVDDAGTLRFTNILELTDWTHWLTWGIQVMPVFFIVGGYANWRSYHSSQRRGDSTGTWITARFRRLMTPIVPFLAVWTAISVIAGLLGVDRSLIRAGSFAVVTPLWFLAVYLLVILAVPVMVPLWLRFGWWTVAGRPNVPALDQSPSSQWFPPHSQRSFSSHSSAHTPCPWLVSPVRPTTTPFRLRACWYSCPSCSTELFVSPKR